MQEVKVIYISINKLVPYAHNPRKNDEAAKVVANSIKEFGFKVPIIIDRKNTIVAGHTRVRAALSLGMTQVPCIVADDLTDEQIKAFRLVDNKSAELAEWDTALLDMELAEIELDLTELGFPELNIDDLGTDFELPSGDRMPFQQMTFTLADEQVEAVNEALTAARGGSLDYDNFGNENSNGNALYRIVVEWLEQQ